jgi:hypothetical protein
VLVDRAPEHVAEVDQPLDGVAAHIDVDLSVEQRREGPHRPRRAAARATSEASPAFRRVGNTSRSAIRSGWLPGPDDVADFLRGVVLEEVASTVEDVRVLAWKQVLPPSEVGTLEGEVPVGPQDQRW